MLTNNTYMAVYMSPRLQVIHSFTWKLGNYLLHLGSEASRCCWRKWRRCLPVLRAAARTFCTMGHAVTHSRMRNRLMMIIVGRFLASGLVRSHSHACACMLYRDKKPHRTLASVAASLISVVAWHGHTCDHASKTMEKSHLGRCCFCCLSSFPAHGQWHLEISIDVLLVSHGEVRQVRCGCLVWLRQHCRLLLIRVLTVCCKQWLVQTLMFQDEASITKGCWWQTT